MVEEDFQEGERMSSYFRLRERLHYIIVLLLLFSLMAGCVRFKKKTESAVTLPEETIPATSTLPSGQAAAALIQEGWENVDKGHLLLAEQKFENALRISPTSGESYLGLASVAYQQKDYQRALEFLQIGAAYCTKHSDLLLRIYILEGDCYRAMGKKKEAQRSYQKAIEIDPDDEALMDRLQEMH